MDALALLCTLYAEGPVTLARLRQAECATIESVLATNPRALASILMATQATAERFQREARNLGERVGPADAGPEIGSYDTGRAKSVQAHPAVLDRVLAAWRERDEHDADDGADRRPEFADIVDEREEILQPAIPARTMLPSRQREQQPTQTIAAGAVDGLDADAAASLARAGVRDLRTLAMCDTLIVARTSGLSWSRVNRLRALASRVPGVAKILAEENDDGSFGAEEKISPSERPLVEHEGLTQLERTSPSMPAAPQALPTRPIRAPVPHALPAATNAPRYAHHAPPEGAGGPFA